MTFLLDIYEVVGLCGAFLIVLAYLLLQVGYLHELSLCYLVCNIGGALLLFYSYIQHWNLASFLINCFWFTIAFIGCIRYWYKRNTS